MIPIYRAKKIDSDEYTCGYLIRADDYEAEVDEDQIVYFIMHKMENYRTNEVWDFVCNSRIDPVTLAIHFPNMLDTKGNKIFASLSENGKGGDILFDMEYEYTVSFDGLKFNLQGLFSQSSFNEFDSWENFDIIGVEE